jgi:hypothetical protein
MIGIAIGVVLVSCLLASMYETNSDIERYSIPIYKGIKRQQRSQVQDERLEKQERKAGISDLEKITLSELPESLGKKPEGVLGELYVKKEVYIRKDLAEK